MRFVVKHHDIVADGHMNHGGKHGSRTLRKLKLKYNQSMWEGAACAGLDTELFFPLEKQSVSLQMYRKLCTECPVFETCLEWAVVHERYGIWAGTSENEREKIRRHAGIAVNELQNDGVLWS